MMDVESVVGEFYSTSDNNRRKELQAILLKVQSEAPLYGLVCLLESDSLSVQVFVAASLHWRLTRQWATVVEYCNTPNSPLTLQSLQSMLIASVQNGENLLLPPIHTKLVQCLAVWILLTVPDIWDQPIQHICHNWYPSHAEALLLLLTEMPIQLRTAALPNDQKQSAKSYMLDIACKSVRSVCSEVLSKGVSDKEESLKKNAIDCLCEWIQISHIQFEHWSQLVVQALHLVTCRCLLEPVTQLFSSLCEQSQSLQLTRDVVGSLFQYSAKLLGPILVRSLADPNSDVDNDTAMALLRAMVTLAESTPHFIINQLTDKGAYVVDVTCILDLLVAFSGNPGRFPVDEDSSEIPAQFWCILEEEATTMEARLHEPIDLSRNARKLLTPLYHKLIVVIVDKMRHPLPDELNEWTAQDRDSFKTYRDSLCSVVCSCYRVLKEQALDVILNTLQSTQNYDVVEVCFLCLWTLTDSLPVECAPLISVVSTVLSQLVDMRSWNVLDNSILKFIHGATHIIIHDNNAHLLQPVISFLSGRLYPDYGQIIPTLKALEALTHERPPSIAHEASNIVDLCVKLFHQGNTPKIRLTALNCVGYTLSLMPQDTIVTALNSILSPRLQKLDELCKASTSFNVSKDDLLFELDVINCLVATIDPPLKHEQQGNGLVVVVLEQSLPLFESLLRLSNQDPIVCNRICACIKSAFGSLLDGASPLLCRVCNILTKCSPPIVSVFNTARTLFLLFARDSSHSQILAQFLTDLIGNVQNSTCGAEPDNVEAFLALYCQIIKKMWNFVTSYVPGTIALVLELCCTVMQTYGESTCVREACAVTCELTNNKMIEEDVGMKLTQICLQRLYIEEVISIVDSFADVLFNFARQYPSQLREWIPEQYRNVASIQAVIKETANKRKCKEFVRRVNLEMKAHRLAAKS